VSEVFPDGRVGRRWDRGGAGGHGTRFTAEMRWSGWLPP